MRPSYLRLVFTPKVVEERLGHSQISLTLDVYSHVLPNMQEEASSKINDLFSSHR